MPGSAKFQEFNAGSALFGSIDSVVTSLSVVDPTKFSPDGRFTVLIDSEYIVVPVGGVSGATFGGVQRGAIPGFPAAPHTGGAIVTQVVTYPDAFQLWPNLVFIATQTANYSANAQEFVPCDSSLGGFNVTLPDASNVGANTPVVVCDLFSGSGVTVVPSAGDTIVGSSWSASVQLQTVTFISDGSTRWYPLAGTGRISAFPDLAAPGATINSTTILGASKVWSKFAAGTYPLIAQNFVPGRLYRMQHDNILPLEFSGVTLSRGTAGFSIEDPVARVPTLSPVAFDVSGATYEYMLDMTSPPGLLCCMRPVR
jgi:hypothetical protein